MCAVGHPRTKNAPRNIPGPGATRKGGVSRLIRVTLFTHMMLCMSVKGKTRFEWPVVQKRSYRNLANADKEALSEFRKWVLALPENIFRFFWKMRKSGYNIPPDS